MLIAHKGSRESGLVAALQRLKPALRTVRVGAQRKSTIGFKAPACICTPASTAADMRENSVGSVEQSWLLQRNRTQSE